MIYIIKKNLLFQFLYGNLEPHLKIDFEFIAEKFNQVKTQFNFEY